MFLLRWPWISYYQTMFVVCAGTVVVYLPVLLKPGVSHNKHTNLMKTRLYAKRIKKKTLKKTRARRPQWPCWFPLFCPLPSLCFHNPFQGFVSRAFCVDLQVDWYLRDVEIVLMILHWWIFFWFPCAEKTVCLLLFSFASLCQRVACYMKVFTAC